MKKILISEETIDKLQLACNQNVENLKLLYKILQCNTLEELKKVQNEILYKITIYDEKLKTII